MAAIRFGTDGVRGRAFTELTESDAFRIGLAAAQVFGPGDAVVGRDTRESGPALVEAVAAGLVAGGSRPFDLGVAPTPAVAYVAGVRSCVGVMVSASHNPWYDNGIKLFSSEGSKLSDEQQAAVEAQLNVDPEHAWSAGPRTSAAGSPVSIQSDVGRWVRAIADSIDSDLAGLRVVIDCANGAASHVAGPALADLGAEVTTLFAVPDGRNINEKCGSTHPEALAKAVLDQGADLGLALDGDADRLLAVDHRGEVVDGDHLMAMLALDMNQRGVLAGSRLVVTVMSNLGLQRAMEAAGIGVEVTPVGDRHVLMAMERLSANLGGEQSGHVIFTDLGGTGDGLLTGMQVMGLIHRRRQSLAELAAAAMTRFPQVLQNVTVGAPITDLSRRLAADIAKANEYLGTNGRVLVRPSGTEPVVRVMVEAGDEDTATRVCDELCEAVKRLSLHEN